MSQQPRHGAGKRAAASLAELVAESPAVSVRESIPPATWARILILAGLFLWLNLWQLGILLRAWLDNPDWSHGFIIPLFSLYFLYSRRDELLSARRRRCLWGLPLLLLGIFQSLAGVWPLQNHWISHAGMIVALFGLVLYLAGPSVIRVTWLPITFLIFAMPISGTLYSRIALPLQELAASASHAVLRLFHVEITVRHSAMKMLSISGVERDLTVAEACSGMRMLVAFLALGVAMAYLDDRPIWQRLTLVLMGIPIAVVCNILRVVITSTMYIWDMPEMGQGFMHTFAGMLMLIPALLMLWGLSWLIQRLFVEEDEEEGTPDKAGRAVAEGADR